jgi:hypothetical protein
MPIQLIGACSDFRIGRLRAFTNSLLRNGVLSCWVRAEGATAQETVAAGFVTLIVTPDRLIGRLQ